MAPEALESIELDWHGAELLFQVLTEREEKKSVAIASNESSSVAVTKASDPRLCAANVDRLTFTESSASPAKAQAERAAAS